MTYSHPKKHHLKWIAAWRCRAIINRCHLSMLICIQADHNFMTFSNAFISEHWEISPRSFWVENCFITGFGNFWKRAEPRTYRETARTVREIEKRNGMVTKLSLAGEVMLPTRKRPRINELRFEGREIIYNIFAQPRIQLTSSPLHNDVAFMFGLWAPFHRDWFINYSHNFYA